MKIKNLELAQKMAHKLQDLANTQGAIRHRLKILENYKTGNKKGEELPSELDLIQLSFAVGSVNLNGLTDLTMRELLDNMLVFLDQCIDKELLAVKDIIEDL